MARKKETGLFCGMFVWAFYLVNGAGVDQVLHFGRSLELPLFHQRFRCVRMQEQALLAALFTGSAW